jgi:hypothetical protein
VKIFCQFRSLAKFLSINFLSYVNDYTEDMVTLTALTKIFPLNIFLVGLGENFMDIPLTDTSESLFHESSESLVTHFTMMHTEPTASGLLEAVR